MRAQRTAVIEIVALVLISAVLYSQSSKNLAYDFAKIADGVYLAVGNDRMPVWCNSVVIISEKETMLVDSSVSPEAARALVADMIVDVSVETDYSKTAEIIQLITSIGTDATDFTAEE